MVLGSVRRSQDHRAGAAWVLDVEVASTVAEFSRNFAERPLDILINNAGVGRLANVEAMSTSDWRTMIDTNLTGVFFCCRAAIPHLKARGAGWIINVSSLSGQNPFAGGACYSATKAGLDAYSHALMQEVRHENIRVAVVAPGSVNTGFINRGSVSDASWKLAADDVALAIADLLEHPGRSLPSRVEIRPSRPVK
jgi:NADP-dependent 3-hydroxy acid dehydrogenase YdfG